MWYAIVFVVFVVIASALVSTLLSQSLSSLSFLLRVGPIENANRFPEHFRTICWNFFWKSASWRKRSAKGVINHLVRLHPGNRSCVFPATPEQPLIDNNHNRIAYQLRYYDVTNRSNLLMVVHFSLILAGLPALPYHLPLGPHEAININRSNLRWRFRSKRGGNS